MTKIYIDPGHGGTDPGAVGNGIKEKDITLAIALKVRDYLNEYEDVSIRMSRTTDTTVSLDERTNDANSWGADYYLSIHINSFNGSANGYEDFIYNGPVRPAAKQIRETIHEEVMKVIDLYDRGMKAANFHVLRESNMPAVLTENGFIDNPRDAAKMKDQNWIQDVARGHVNGLVKAFNLVKRGSGIREDNDIMAQPLEPSVNALNKSVQRVLFSFEQDDRKPLSPEWREKFERRELSVSDAIALLYLAIERNYLDEEDPLP